MKVRKIRALVASVAALSAADSMAMDVRLRCDGVATFPDSATSYTNVTGDAELQAYETKTSRAQVRDRVLVEATDAGARVRLPRAMVPPINGGGRDGWWTLSDYAAGEDEIAGKFRLNAFNKPSVRIDRRSGDIEIQGSFKLSFRGKCEVNGSPSERLF